MTIKKQGITRIVRILGPVALFAVLALMANDVRGFGIGQVMKAKSLPDATIAVIDPESGTSGGTAGSDVNLAVGDIILFRFSYAPVPDKSNRSLQSYVTEYLPSGTEIVGVRIIDKDGKTVRPNLPGMAVDGCTGGSNCNTFNNLPCNAGADNCSFGTGSIAQVHGDTGIFYTTDARMARNPSDAFISTENGTVMNPVPASVTDIDQLLDVTAPYYAHNAWDWTQVQAYGTATSASGTAGDGNTPFGYGSPVAGPDSFYQYEATDTGANGIEFNNVVGPWQRIKYPGSKVGFGTANMGNSGIVTRKILDASATGFDVTPANPIQNATALRWAVGEARTGQAAFVEVALRVTAVPIDNQFGGVGGNVNCGEVTGSGLSARSSGFSGSTTATQPQTGATTNWAYYLGSSACVFLRLKFDITSDKALADGQPITFTIDGKNLSVNDETNVVVRQQFDSSKLSYVAGSAVPAPDNATPTTCPPPDTTLSCLTWTLGTLAPSDEYQLTSVFNSGGGGQISATMEGVYTSTELGSEFRTRDVVMIVPLAQPAITVTTEFDQTVTPASANSTTNLVGALTNAGTNDFNFSGVSFELPAGWTGGTLVVNGVNYSCMWDCATNVPAYPYNISMASGGSHSFTMPVNVPPGTMTGLYPVTVAIWGSQTGGGFGGEFETAYENVVEIAVGAPRTQKPVLDCPINSTTTAITGASEPNADVSVLFTLIERGTGTADGAGDFSVTNFTAFGGLYGGLEVRATAQAPGKLRSELSDPCEVTSVRACSDTFDNDGDGLIDFPADPGCESPQDSDETDVVYECSDTTDNDGNGATDFPDDLSCYSPQDDSEDGVPSCSDGVDNDGDGNIDFPADSDCTDAMDNTEAFTRACQNRIDDDGDGFIDYEGQGAAMADPGCHSAFDDDETDVADPAGSIRARLLVVFDTSGSMNWNTCEPNFTGGDGSLDCAGGDVACADLPMTCSGGSTLTCDNGQADDSRLFKVKSGLSDVVAAFGEVDYALMRFHQRGEDFACPTAAASLGSGGWQGGGAAPCGGGFSGGDVVVSFASDNQYTILEWLDGESNYPVTDPPPGYDLELRGSGTTPLGGALDDALTYVQNVQAGDPASACRPYRVVLVTDGEETCDGDPVAAATALKNAGVFVSVIGFATDDAGIQAELNAIANAGSQSGNDPAIFADDDASLSSAIASIIADSVLAELCNNLDDDCDTFIDEDFDTKGDACDNGQLGVCYDNGMIECRPDGLGVQCNAPDGSGNSTGEVCNVLDDDCDGLIDEGITCTCSPISEICNGVDDDCDMLIDEGPIPGVGDPCGISLGECMPGALACVGGSMQCQGGVNPQPTDSCDGLDEDCDTFIDEGLGVECYSYPTGCVDNMGVWTCNGICQTGSQECVGGMPGACVGDSGPQLETCNGIDDDCDGNVDEDYPNLGDTCDNSQMGACLITGTILCLPNGSGTYCTAPMVPPGSEVCNGLDDDCDGILDEALGPPVGLPCGGGMDCTVGMFECVDPDMDPMTPNSGIQCVGSVGGEPETCNGLDDDCDMVTDEDIPGVGQDCYTYPVGCDDMTGICEGICELGALVCNPGGVVCEGDTGPGVEVCNGIDDDCDGVADNMAQCPAQNEICVEGTCVRPCGMGEFNCPLDFYCETLDDSQCAPGDPPPCTYCLPDPCADVTCPMGHYCDQQDGSCIDPCDNTMCQDGETCRPIGGIGVCFDCFDPSCAGQQHDYCCGDDELCVSDMSGVGSCEPDPCAGVMCGPGEFCQDGVCSCTTCAPACGTGEICNQATCECEADPCSGVNCPANQVCDPTIIDCMGTDCCVGNNCFMVNCPDGQACNPSDGSCCVDPCVGINCGAGFHCETDFGCRSVCVADPDTSEHIYAGGSGCSVADEAPTTGSWLAGLFIGGLLWWRRRRTAVAC